MSDVQAVLAKVRKLRALAARTTAHEAATAAAAADRLIQQHRLTQAEVEDDAEDLVEAELVERVRQPVWEQRLVVRLCLHYGCAGYRRWRTGAKQTVIYGHPDDVAILVDVWTWIRGEARELLRRAKAQQAGRLDARSWMIGFVDGVYAALQRSAADQMRAHPKGAMVLAGRGDRAEEALKAKLVGVPSVAERAPRVDVGYGAGYTAGRAVDVATRTKRIES